MERSLMKSAVSLITVFAICSTVYGDIAKIVEGYGKTQWGQSLETVQKAIPDGTVKQDNRQGNVMGMMPHPERASEALLSSEDVRFIFKSMIDTVTRINH